VCVAERERERGEREERERERGEGERLWPRAEPSGLFLFYQKA
jgi:hypothetical protein